VNLDKPVMEKRNMNYIVIGKENSGKSELAEKLAMETGDACRIYLATMKVYDETGFRRIERHRKMREGKGFVTVEQEYNILNALSELDNPEESTVLLECASNLAGNELYENQVWNDSILNHMDSPDLNDRKAKYVDYISNDIKKLADSVNNLVIVTNEYESDGENYDDNTRLYVELLNMVNERLIQFSDKVYDLRKSENVENI